MSEQDKLLGHLQANQTSLLKAIDELKQQIKDELKQQIKDMDASTTQAYSELNARVMRLERTWRDIRIGTRIVLWVAAAIGSAIGAIGTWIINIMKA